MIEQESRWCALMACSDTLYWAVPQNCLAEIVTMHTARTTPPERIRWRGESVPVLCFSEEQAGWRDEQAGAGLLAILLGLRDEGCDYWAVAIRGDGLTVRNLAEEDLQEAPEELQEGSTAAFRLAGRVYQVPDLPAIQRQVAATLQDVA